MQSEAKGVSKKIIIIGGGIGGLATAAMLAKAGCDVTIYEKNSQLGGRAGQKETAGFRFDTGPSWYLMPAVFRHYFSLFNIDVDSELAVKKLTPAYKVFFQSRDPLTVNGNVATDRQTFDEVEPGAGAALETYVKEGDQLYTMAMRHFLYTNFQSPFDFLHKDIITRVGPMANLLRKPIHDRVKTFVASQPLQQILEYPMVFLGTSPFKAPAMYSLMSALDFHEGVYYPQKGMYSIIQLLEKVGRLEGVTYHTNSDVTRIVSSNGVATGVEIAGRVHPADIVISNADLHYTETRLLAPADRSYPERFWQKKEAGITALLLYIGVKGSLPQLEHHNLFFVDKWRQNFEALYDDKTIPESASLYVSRTSATDPSVAPAGHETLFMLVPLPTNVMLTQAETDTLASRCIAQLAKTIDTPDLAERIVSLETFGPADFETSFHAWQGTALGMSHLLKQSALWRIPNHSKKLRHLYYVGANTVPGIGLPMCLISAQLAYKRIAGIKKGGPVTSIVQLDNQEGTA